MDGTERMMLGMLPSSEITCKRSTASLFPTISLTYIGRYFSTCGKISKSSYMHGTDGVVAIA